MDKQIGIYGIITYYNPSYWPGIANPMAHLSRDFDVRWSLEDPPFSNHSRIGGCPMLTYPQPKNMSESQISDHHHYWGKNDNQTWSKPPTSHISIHYISHISHIFSPKHLNQIHNPGTLLLPYHGGESFHPKGRDRRDLAHFLAAAPQPGHWHAATSHAGDLVHVQEKVLTFCWSTWDFMGILRATWE